MGEKMVGFAARGGWWVFAQVPVLLGALLVPLVWGAASSTVGMPYSSRALR